jgi:hypothetical protein
MYLASLSEDSGLEESMVKFNMIEYRTRKEVKENQHTAELDELALMSDPSGAPRSSAVNHSETADCSDRSCAYCPPVRGISEADDVILPSDH